MPKPDPRQLKDEAQAAVVRGKWKKALEAYLTLEKIEPRDGTWPQRAGEMYRKLSQRPDAVAALSRAAEAYSASGFLLKAVAVCKIILELEPDHTWTRERLAQLTVQHSKAPAMVGLTPARPAPAPSAPPPLAAAPPPPVVERPRPPPPPRRKVERHETLEEIELGPLFPGAQVSREISLESVGVAIEIPLDDEVEEVEEVDEAGETARRLLPRTPLFSSLDERRLAQLIENVKLEQYDAEHTVFRQGDAGDALYVIASGEVSVRVGETEVARLAEGAFFGEIALIARQPRNATVVTAQPTDLLVIPREALFELIEDEPAVMKVILRFVRDRLLERLMGMSPLFAPFSPRERKALAARFRFLEAADGTTLLTQGQKAVGLFVLLAGSARVFLDGANVAELGSGQIIGEISLLGQTPASATIVTARRSYLLEMPRADFSELIMTHPQVLEHLHDIAERRKAELALLRSGQKRYGEARLTIV